MNTKILIIENQWIEFEKMCETISKSGYDILLDNDVYWNTLKNIIEKEQKFISLATKIRIWVDEDNGYDKIYREKAFNSIFEFAKKADIIIIDHILGGSYSCLTGIDLAENLVEKIGIEQMPPILFVSKTESNEKNLINRYEGEYIIENDKKPGYKNFIKNKFIMKDNELDKQQNKEKLKAKINAHTKWVHKGYFGDEILLPEYIKKYVIEEGIKELSDLSIKQKLLGIISDCNTYNRGEIARQLQCIYDKCELSEYTEKFIFFVLNYTNINYIKDNIITKQHSSKCNEIHN
jgi:hypothetical protein